MLALEKDELKKGLNHLTERKKNWLFLFFLYFFGYVEGRYMLYCLPNPN